MLSSAPASSLLARSRNAAPAGVRATERDVRTNSRAADDRLEALDLLGQRRLGDVQPLSGAGEMLLLGDGDEIAQVSQLEIHRHSILI